MKKVSGVYKITNTISKKYYIGSTSNYAQRRRAHLSELRRGLHNNKYLQNAYNKYGEDAFVFELLEEVETSHLKEVEQQYLNELDFSNCYNLSKNSNGASLGEDNWFHHNVAKGENHPMYGKKHKDESKRRISNSLKGIRNPFYGKSHSKEFLKWTKESQEKEWLFVTPLGDPVAITGLIEFCKENNLDVGTMGKVERGQKKHCKGWRRLSVETVNIPHCTSCVIHNGKYRHYKGE